MNRVTRGSVVLAAALVVLSCEGDPTSDLRSGADHLVATPSTLLIGTGGTTTVLIEALDKQGNRLESGFSVGTVDAGLAVEEDTTYNKVYNNKGELLPPSKWTRAQYIVTATAAAGDLSFTVDAGGKSISVPVRIVPATIATLSTATVAAITDTVTATAPAGYRFTPATTVLFGTATSHVVGISTDSLTIRFVAPAAVTAGTATFSNLSLPYTEPTRYTATGGPLTTPAAPALPFTTTAVNALDTVTLAAPAGFRFTPGFAATSSLISVDSVAGQIARGAGKISTAADSGSARFIAGKGRNGRTRATNMQIRGAPGAGRYTLRSAVGQVLTSTAAYPAATVNKTSAAPGDTIIVTVPNGMRFQPNAAPGTGTVAIGASTDSTQFSYIISSGVTRSSITRATLP
ncbi:MAG: hypothetical protein OEW17_09280, partial [Gemmatimonadota bacterium]|nr:hypothetical protein [Gemmatimonadota bacterium]